MVKQMKFFQKLIFLPLDAMSFILSVCTMAWGTGLASGITAETLRV